MWETVVEISRVCHWPSLLSSLVISAVSLRFNKKDDSILFYFYMNLCCTISFHTTASCMATGWFTITVGTEAYRFLDTMTDSLKYHKGFFSISHTRRDSGRGTADLWHKQGLWCVCVCVYRDPAVCQSMTQSVGSVYIWGSKQIFKNFLTGHLDQCPISLALKNIKRNMQQFQRFYRVTGHIRKSVKLNNL